MKTSYRIAIIIILILSIIGVFVLLIMPLAKGNTDLTLKIAENNKNKIEFERNIKAYTEIKSRYYILNARLDKYNTQLPFSVNIPVLTEQIYEIEKYSGIKISSINFQDIASPIGTVLQSPIGSINIKLIMTGSYYQTLIFLNTLEIMPRLVKIGSISINSNLAEGNDTGENNLNQIMLATSVSFSVYYDKTEYKTN